MTEDQLEQETLAWLVELGYGHRFGPDIAHDGPAWRELFLRQWPAGSAAHRSYWPRIQRGPAYTVAEAMPGTMTILPVT